MLVIIETKPLVLRSNTNALDLSMVITLLINTSKLSWLCYQSIHCTSQIILQC